jgi:hypothetical protein
MPSPFAAFSVSRMPMEYAIVWREGELSQGTGKLELLPHALRLDGVCGGEETIRDVGYDELVGLRIGRAQDERIAGRTSLVLDRRNGPAIRIASFGTPNLVSEIAEGIASLLLGGAAARRTAVVVPIEPGSYERARALIEQGPPFDPERIRLDRYQVFLSPTEVVLIFESRVGQQALEALLSDPGILAEASAWSQLLAGPPRIAESAYAWSRADGSPSHAQNGSWSYDF